MPADLMPELALVPSGAFLMGTDDGDEDERPAHRVELDDFLIGVRPVTQAEYARFVAETGYRPPVIHELPLVVTAGGEERERRFREIGRPYAWVDGGPPPLLADHPVTLVRWEDAAAYCTWLAGATGRPIRLPTEAEWEKAARGGLEGRRYPWGDDVDPGLANFLDPAAQPAGRGTTPCGAYGPNGYGLVDMAGNVWEWVQDWYAPRFYDRGDVRNPVGRPHGAMRLLRGGSWLSADVRMLSCSYRHKVPPDTYSYAIGFRIALSV